MSPSASADDRCVLVTGASGFLGSHVVAKLLAAGHRVVAHRHRRELQPGLSKRCLRVVTGDLSEIEVQRQALDGVDTVCHLAAYIPSHSAGLESSVRCYAINAQASLALATLAAERGISRFVFTSTGNMYASSEGPCRETDSIFPADYATDYMVSKLAAEIYLINLSRRTPIEVVILRVASAYGPGEPSDRVIPTFLRLAAKHQPLRLVGGGEARYNFVYVADVAELTKQALCAGGPGIFNVGSGQHTSLLELAYAVRDLDGRDKVAIEIETAGDDAPSGFPAIAIDGKPLPRRRMRRPEEEPGEFVFDDPHRCVAPMRIE